MAHGAELFDASPHGRLVDRQQGHNKVILLESLPLRINAHEYIRDGLLVGRLRDLQCRQHVTLKAKQRVKPALNGILSIVIKLRLAFFDIRLVQTFDERLAEALSLLSWFAPKAPDTSGTKRASFSVEASAFLKMRATGS